MKTTKVGEFEISMKWQYGVRNPLWLRPHETKCTIVINRVDAGDEGSVGYEGIAKRFHKDVFCKESARRSSLQHALVDCLSRPLRTAIWAAYWHRRPTK